MKATQFSLERISRLIAVLAALTLLAQNSQAQLERTIAQHTGAVGSVAYSPDSAQIASGSNDNAIRIWNAGTGELIRTLTGHTDDVWSVAYSPDGAQIASGSNDNAIRIWNAGTGEHIRTLTGHTGNVTSVAYSPDGAQIASGSNDNAIRIWNADTGEHIRTLTGHTDDVWSVAYSPDGAQIASGDGDGDGGGAIRIWNAGTGAHIRTLTGHTGNVTSVAYSPDGAQIASGSGDGAIRIWNADTGEHIRPSLEHREWVNSVAYSLDSSQIASGSDDGAIRIWNADTGELIRTLTGHTSYVYSVAYSPDGTRLASVGDDNTIRIWKAPTTPITVEISSTSDSVAGAFDATITFSEAVEGFKASDINVTNGSVTNLAGSGAAYTAAIAPSKPGAVTVSVPANAAGNNRASEVYTVNYVSSVEISGPRGSVAGAFDVTITFSEAVEDFEASDINVTNGSVMDLAGSGATYTPAIAPSKPGAVTVSVPANAAGNNRASEVYTVNYVSSVEISGPSGSVTGAFDVTIAFSSAVAGFEASDINVTNGAVTKLAGSGAAYTATIKPTSNGAVTAVVPANAAGNNQASNVYTVQAAQSATFTISLKRGLNLIHVPVKDERLSKVSDLYNALGGSSDVDYILSHIPSATDSGKFAAYVGIPGSLSDTALSDQTAVIARMRTAKNVSFTGGLLNDTVTLTEGVNLIGVPRAEAVEKASGVAPNAAAVLVLTRDSLGNALFSLVVPNTPSDVAAVGGQGYIVVANADDSIAYTGGAWKDPEVSAPAAAASTDAVKFDPTSAPVLLVEGLFAREDTLEPVNGLQMTIRNLRTGESVVDMAGLTGSSGRFVKPMIALRGGRLYKEGDTLEVSVVDPSGTFGGLTPVRAVVGKDEIAAGRVDIGRQLLSAVPSKTALLSNYPNPFNPETWIPFELADSSRVRVTIYNSAGQTVRVLELGQLPAGSYHSRAKAAYWDGCNALGESVASGIYYARIEAGSFTALRRMVVLK